mgnify:CR=1 FL=1
MSSAAGVRYSNRSVSRSAFQKCMGRVPSDEKFPDDMSAEGKCTVVEIVRSGLHIFAGLQYLQCSTGNTVRDLTIKCEFYHFPCMRPSEFALQGNHALRVFTKKGSILRISPKKDRIVVSSYRRIVVSSSYRASPSAFRNPSSSGSDFFELLFVSLSMPEQLNC